MPRDSTKVSIARLVIARLSAVPDFAYLGQTDSTQAKLEAELEDRPSSGTRRWRERAPSWRYCMSSMHRPVILSRVRCNPGKGAYALRCRPREFVDVRRRTFSPVATCGNPRFAESLRDHSSVPPAPCTVLERIVRRLSTNRRRERSGFLDKRVFSGKLLGGNADATCGAFAFDRAILRRRTGTSPIPAAMRRSAPGHR